MPIMRACVRGRGYRKFVYHPDRLKYPMKRVGKRGEGKFERISWDEATTLIADNLKGSRNNMAQLHVMSMSGRLFLVEHFLAMRWRVGC